MPGKLGTIAEALPHLVELLTDRASDPTDAARTMMHLARGGEAQAILDAGAVQPLVGQRPAAQ